MERIDTLRALRVSGADATTFLHGQFCADLLSLGAGAGCLTAWCNPKGRAITTLLAFRDTETWTLFLPADLATRVTQRLNMFVLRARVTLTLAPDGAAVLLLNESESGHLSPVDSRRLLRLPPAPGSTDSRFLLAADASELSLLALSLNPSDVWSEESVRTLLPWVGAATSEQFIPQELNLEAWGGLSLTKGCYPGQEIVARLHYRGTTKRRVRALQVLPPGIGKMTPGTTLLAGSGNTGAVVLHGNDRIAAAVAVVETAIESGAELFFGAGTPAVALVTPGD